MVDTLDECLLSGIKFCISAFLMNRTIAPGRAKELGGEEKGNEK